MRLRSPQMGQRPVNELRQDPISPYAPLPILDASVVLYLASSFFRITLFPFPFFRSYPNPAFSFLFRLPLLFNYH